MLNNNNSLFHQILKMRYLFAFAARGVRRVLRDRRLLLVGAGYIAAGFVLCHVAGAAFSGPMAVAIGSLYRLALTILFAAVGCFGLWHLGLPKDFLRILGCLSKISLVNAAGEYPVLLSRKPSGKNARGEIWEFESYGVPASAFVDATEELESALDIALVTVKPGDDGRKVLLDVVPHPGPWPEVLPWAWNKLPEKASVIALGENRGEQVLQDFSVRPHLMIGGQTGSGKSVLMKTVMLQCLLHDWKVVLIDYKRLVDYGKVWKERCEMVTEDSTLLATLDGLCAEMERRLKLLAAENCANIDEYREKTGEFLPRVGVFFDEIAECLDAAKLTKEGKETKQRVEKSLSSLARLARAAGIHLVIATQRGGADVLPGQVRSNIQSICGIANENLSILTLGTAEADKRIPKDARGRFLKDDGTMFQGYFCRFEEADFDLLFGFTLVDADIDCKVVR